MNEPIKVLVIEDMKTIRLLLAGMLQLVLKGRPATLLEACDGEEGLELARRERPDLIFTDVEMPNLDGLKLCGALRSEPALAGTPVVLLTSKAELRSRGLAAGASAFLSKPLKLKELEAVVAGLLGNVIRPAQSG